MVLAEDGSVRLFWNPPRHILGPQRGRAILNRVRLWTREQTRMVIDNILQITAAVIAFVMAYYSVLTVKVELAPRRFFRWAPFVFSYHKRQLAIRKLINTDRSVPAFINRVSNSTAWQSSITKDDIGFHELLKLIARSEGCSLGKPDRMIYLEEEAALAPVDGAPYVVSTSLMIETEGNIEIIKTTPGGTTGVGAYLMEANKLELWGVIAPIILTGAALLIVISTGLTILKWTGVLK